MYRRSGGGYMGRNGGPGYDRGPDSYWSPPEPWIPPYNDPDRGSGYYDRPKRGRYGYSEPERGYRRRRKQHPPHHAPPWWRGGPRGSFRGNFGPTRPVRGARHLNQSPIPEMDQFQQLRPFVDNFYFGGGIKLKTKRWRAEQYREYEEGEPPVEKIKTTAENSGDAEETAHSAMSDGDREDGTQEETEASSKKYQETLNEILDHNLVNKIQFFCTLCKFRTFYEEEWTIHHQSRFHKENFQKMYKHLPKEMAGFFEAYVENNYKKAKYERKQVEDLSTKLHQIYRNRDVTQGLSMDHFVKKVEVAHCGACDIFLPMNSSILQKHIGFHSHKNNCKRMMNVSKEIALNTAMTILGNKRNKYRLEQYTNGKNPFLKDDEEIRSGCSRDLAPEAEESGDMPCITLSDSEGEEDDDFQGQNPFINDEQEEEEDDTRSECSTELVPETEESQQMPCSPLPDSERDEEEDSGEQVTEQETACESL